MIISVIGASNPTTKLHLELAEAVGRELAQRGVLSGVMEAVCRGAKSAGGVTIGILPGGVAADANSYVDIPIVTNMGYSRNAIVAYTGRAVIAVGGAYGTLSEISLALAENIPVVGLETWELTRNGDGQPVHGDIILASGPDDAVDKALAAAAARDD